eukprot:GEZU01014018.1.p1 GENE.GEZU01014018.1~~GEZU01014018.1.p1  ORF type:complete len:329 (-),score=39.80 GEZU01014018.1:64-1050(-)
MNLRQRFRQRCSFSINKKKQLFFLPVIAWLLLFQFAGKIPVDIRPEIDTITLARCEVMLLGGFPHQVLPAAVGTLFGDLFCALPYTIHFILPFIALAYITIWHRKHFYPFVFCFGLMNLTAVVTQLVFPTAPPWYFEKYGIAPANYSMYGDAGRLANIDKYFGITLYTNMYKTSPVVFGSFPSLHAAWPFVIAVFLYVIHIHDPFALPAEQQQQQLQQQESEQQDHATTTIINSQPMAAVAAMATTTTITTATLTGGDHDSVVISGFKSSVAPASIPWGSIAARAMFLYACWVWWAAIYLQHHYFVDIVGGVFFALFSYYVTVKLVKP